MRKGVLFVAREVEIRARFARRLQSSGYAVELACDERRALRLARDCHFHVAIMVPEPGLASLATMQQLRDRVPEMIVLAEGPDEIARLRRSLSGIEAHFLKTSDEGAVITRVGEITSPDRREWSIIPGIFSLEDCKLDLAGCVFVDASGREVTLTRTESNLLKELVSSPCQVLSREKLRRALSGRGAEPFDRSIDMIVARVRHKIEPDPKAARFLVTVPGVGYKLMVRPPSADARPSGAEPATPERRQLTALACNLVGTMAFAVKFDPEDLSRITKDFEGVVVAAVTRMGGTITSVEPGQILALFGYPEAHEDAAERAVDAGLDAVANIGQFQSPLGEPLQVQVAVATGLALACGKQAFGEPRAIVEGICNRAAPSSVVVAASTHRLLSGAFVCDNAERYEFAGLSQPVSAYRVTGKRTVKSRFTARCLDKVTRLVGRDQELQQLLALWDRAKRGKGQVGLICGEAGIGKSHLCEAFLSHIAEEPHTTIRYQCSRHHIDSPFYPVISQLEQALDLEPMDEPEIKLKKLVAALPPALRATRDDVSLYTALLSIAPPVHQTSSDVTPRSLTDVTISALTRYLLGLTDKQPLAIVLAGTHWIDSSTIGLINRIIALIKTARVLVLVTFRPEFIPQWVGEPHVTLLRLGPLGREQSRAMISEVTGGKKLRHDVEEQILDKTDGVPLFVEELTKTALESERLQDVGDQYVSTGSWPPLAVPATLLDSLTARLDRLGPAKEIAQIGAVIGREFSYPLLAAVVPLSANSLKAVLARLVDCGLIFVSADLPNDTYAFKHAMVQDAAYALLSRQKRQQIHARIADALESNFPFMIETQPGLLAHHLAQAGAIERAVDYLRKAGQRTIDRSARAIGHLTAEVKLVQSLSNGQERKQTRLDLQGDDGAINDRESWVRAEHSADRSLRRVRKPSERHPIRAARVTGPGRRNDWAQEAQAPARRST